MIDDLTGYWPVLVLLGVGSTMTFHDNTTNRSTPESELRAALGSFETSITTPLVSGELADWVEKAMRAWREASSQIHFQTRHAHPRQYEEISEADPALFQRVELLRAEDEAIEVDRDKLHQSMARMAHHVPQVEPDEAKAQPFINTVTDQAILFIARVRKQEVAVQTWFAEAFNRERGGGD
jgi:hypothetical protein